MNADVVIGPLIHRSPAQPVAVLETPKDSFDVLLAGVAKGDLLGGPIHAIGKQHGATQTMIDEPLYKVPLFLGSFLTGWSRIHDDRHYFSQVALGWWIAYLSVHSVDRTQEERAVTLTPFTADGPGLGVQVRY